MQVKNKKILIAAPICEGKNYSINEWLNSVAIMMRRNPSSRIDYAFSVNNATLEYEQKLNQIELRPFGPRLISKPIVLRLMQTIKEGTVTIISRSREQLRQYAVTKNYDYILWLDTDTIPPLDVLERLMSHNLPFVSGVYTYKGTDRVVATWVVDKKQDLCSNVPFEHIKTAGLNNSLIEIRGCGFGCVLMNKEVFKDIPFEWIDLGKNQSEDIRYCQRCNEKGFKIWLDARAMCLHKSNDQYEATE